MKNFAIKYGKIFHMLSVPFFLILGVGSYFINKTPYFIPYFIIIILLVGLFSYIETIWYNNRTELYYTVNLTEEEIKDIINALIYADAPGNTFSTEDAVEDLIDKFKYYIGEEE